MTAVHHRLLGLSLFLSFGCTFPVFAQALLPPSGRLNFGNLEQQGLSLAKDAAQLIKFEQVDLALPRARLAVQLAPKSYQAQAVLGSVYLRQEQYDKAIISLQIAHGLRKDNPSVLFTLGSAYLRKGDYTKAIESIQSGLSLPNQESISGAQFDLGNAYFLSKRYDDAIGEYKKVVGTDRTFWAAINNIGLVEYERDNVDLAIKQWQESVQQAVKAEDAASEPRLALGVAFYTRGDQSQGMQLAEEALRQDPRYGMVEFLKENLWGEKLLTDARKVLALPKLKELIDSSTVSMTRKPRQR